MLVLLLSLLVACGGGDSAFNDDIDDSDNAASNGGGGDDNLSAFAIEMLAAVNAERATEGLSTLSWDSRLEAAALAHAQDMVDNDFLDHEGSDGSDVGDRVTAAAYTWNWVGENIAMGQTSITQVMAAWMASDGHRANILHVEFSQMGAARVGNHWVQVFANLAPWADG